MDQKFYVYVLRSQKDKKLYTGHTQDIPKRISEHNSGKVKSTASRKPFDLVYSEEFDTRSEARWRERYLKTACGKKKIYLKLESSIPL